MHVRLAQAGQDGFAGLVVAPHLQRRVLLGDPRQHLAHLVQVGLGGRRDGGLDQRRGHVQRGHLVRGAVRHQRVAGGDVVQLGDERNVAGHDDSRLLAALAHRVLEAREALVSAAGLVA